jgi:hypothetical protein
MTGFGMPKDGAGEGVSGVGADRVAGYYSGESMAGIRVDWCAEE